LEGGELRHGSLCMPSPNAQLYTYRGLAHPTSHFEHYFLLYIYSSHNPPSTDAVQVKELQVIEFQSHSSLFLQKVIKLKEKHFYNALNVSLRK